jgi:hypothetical protein
MPLQNFLQLCFCDTITVYILIVPTNRRINIDGDSMKTLQVAIGETLVIMAEKIGTCLRAQEQKQDAI